MTQHNTELAAAAHELMQAAAGLLASYEAFCHPTMGDVIELDNAAQRVRHALSALDLSDKRIYAHLAEKGPELRAER